MPKVQRPGRTGKYVELPNDLVARLVTFCVERGTRPTDEIRTAIQRHLDHPPPRPGDAPLLRPKKIRKSS